MNKEWAELLTEKFLDIIITKNSWGKKEVLVAYNQALTETLLELLDKQENSNG